MNTFSDRGSCLTSLEVPGVLPRPVDVQEGVLGAGLNSLWPAHLEAGLLQAVVELVVLHAPPPVLVRHPLHQLKVHHLHEQDGAQERRVVVLGVEPGGGDVERSLSWEFVTQVFVEGQQVDVVHSHVVAVTVAVGRPHVQEADIDERGAVEPGQSLLRSLIFLSIFDFFVITH